jgi:DNA-binding transcriptional MerR regulator
MKEEVQLREILSRKDEKLNLQRQIVQLHMNGMKIKKIHEYKKQTREEHLQLRKKEAEFQEKQVEAHLLTAEVGIMAINMQKVPPLLKNYYIGMQK